MRSYIKLYGPNLEKALKALEDLLSKEEKVVGAETIYPAKPRGLFSSSKVTVGEYDFVFEWIESPTVEDITALISDIDDALTPTKCKYTITTKE